MHAQDLHKFKTNKISGIQKSPPLTKKVFAIDISQESGVQLYAMKCHSAYQTAQFMLYDQK